MLVVIDGWNPELTRPRYRVRRYTWQLAPGRRSTWFAGMPYTTGPGGTLTNTSLDQSNSSNHGFTTSEITAGITRD